MSRYKKYKVSGHYPYDAKRQTVASETKQLSTKTEYDHIDICDIDQLTVLY